jgi:hypothetical protein
MHSSTKKLFEKKYSVATEIMKKRFFLAGSVAKAEMPSKTKTQVSGLNKKASILEKRKNILRPKISYN